MADINDLLYDKLGTLGFVGALPDRAYDHLGSLGYTGAMNDRLSLAGGYRAYVEGLLGSVTKNFINLLGDPPQAHYELATPWTAAGDFEIEVDFSTTGSNNGKLFDTAADGLNRLVLWVSFSTGTIQWITPDPVTVLLDGVEISTNTVSVTDGLLHKLKMVGTGGGTVGVLGMRFNSIDYFKGIISDVKLTDITTPANSLSFGLDNLTGDTEVSNGVTLNYRNIASDVRDTYTLTDGDWVGSEAFTPASTTFIDNGDGTYTQPLDATDAAVFGVSNLSLGAIYIMSARTFNDIPSSGQFRSRIASTIYQLFPANTPAGSASLTSTAITAASCRFFTNGLPLGTELTVGELSMKRLIEVA